MDLFLILTILGLILAIIATRPEVARLWRRLRRQPDPIEKRLEELAEAVRGLKEAFNHVIPPPTEAGLAAAVQQAVPEPLAEATRLASDERFAEAIPLLEAAFQPTMEPLARGTIHFLLGNAHYRWSQQEEQANREERRRERLQAALDHYSEAARLTRAVGEADAEAEALNNRGLAYRHLGRYQEALADFTRALALRPDYPEAPAGRGLAYYHLGRYQEALADYSRALELRPDWPEALVGRGVAYYHLGRHEEALADYSRALELRPDYPEALVSRGVAYRHLGRYEEALADYSRALALRPQYPVALYNRGLAYRHLGRYEEALADYDRALELRPDFPGPAYHMACAFCLVGRSSEALEWLEKAIALDGKYREMAKGEEAFASLRDDTRFRALVGLEGEPA